MLRFILKKINKNGDHPKIELFYSVTLDVPELEKELQTGGFGPCEFERVELVGVEFLADGEKERLERLAALNIYIKQREEHLFQLQRQTKEAAE